ncbi:2-oxo-4-hydroxy-4-carboxy-5-ureidoimidazoline decarboxylase [Streptomyces beijiangensis]|uniref:2-oxo-4-hydroxy-4-carboxy-5-ureidoimidazoline decarboxylase n=1 Tax=Streptomyces beijiangensis TaxID=163361 RepID=A0A939F1U4_9ACTN|nr:2-oxo-4-hydroxy-4-carboxy-5-ureidoimidazoline decarboxylase [Streptomyces beijiangensis]MBO0510655.1 2-oxo-4-hydroxy-4-carboxy-5-ureidoimidazoline decarboxylase [Streptomyces beijiangensis]
MRPSTLHHTRAAIPAQRHPSPGLQRFNTASADTAEAALLACCGSHRWARRVAAHRPYPDLDSLLAAADEASYDLSPAELSEALADETPPGLHPGAPAAAHTALRAAQGAYESRFGHAFVICLDRVRPAEHLDHVLAGIRSRLAHDPDEERAVAADELRSLARGRIAHLMAASGPSDSPSVPV